MLFLNKLLTVYRGLVEPMPIGQDFADYDEYWRNRTFAAAKGAAIRRAEHIAPKIAPDSTILDLGCGSGDLLEHLQEHCQPKRLVGIDISQQAVQRLRDRGVEAECLDIASSEFANYLQAQTFDHIIVTEVLEHIPNPEVVIESLHGHFNQSVFVSIPNSGFFLHRIRLLCGRFPIVVIQEHIKEHLRFWTLRDFHDWAGFHGYEVVDQQVTTGLEFEPLAFLESLRPSLFGQQIIFELRLNDIEQ